MKPVAFKQIEKMHMMLSETREKVEELTDVVRCLHFVVTNGHGGDAPPPESEVVETTDGEDDEEMLREKNIVVGSKELMQILCISKTTLKRWRKDHKISCTYVSQSHVTYKLLHIYLEIKSGRLRIKGFDSILAMESIVKFARKARIIRPIPNSYNQ